MMTDPVADMLTRIRNAVGSKHERVELPHSLFKLGVLKVLEEEGYVRSVSVISEANKSRIVVTLKYGSQKEPMISFLKRVSKPGRRVYAHCDALKPVLGGLGLSIISTSKGVMSDKKAKESKLGGEIVCTIW
ncbi:MAG: 30S ribosomal protein S8 [Deltaproteobacteria bacterium]|nr:30S ribosomal protein S8 [Deltaproteobacteria bacterium]